MKRFAGSAMVSLVRMGGEGFNRHA